MVDNEKLLNQLRALLVHKKSKQYYADRLGITVKEINDLLEDINTKKVYRKDQNTTTEIEELEDSVTKYFEDLEKGIGEVVFNSDTEIKTLDELIAKCNIDIKKWDIQRYVQNYWGNCKNPHWQVKAWLALKKDEKTYQDSFIEFLQTYQPSSATVNPPLKDLLKPLGCLLINKQDAHYNRHDGVNGDNDIQKRFENIYNKITTILKQARLSNNLENVLYILGSDVFNSEATGMTTSGTPQENFLTYHDAFEKVCNHEVMIINTMLSNSDTVDVVFMPGNHDAFAGWHLLNWLKVYYRNNERVRFDIAPSYRKYVSYGVSAMMFNHGDKIKPERLAAIFPIEFREGWSSHKNFYIFTGDKHTEMSHDFNGIEFYRISAFTTVSSQWEDKNGYIGRKPGVTGFLIDISNGITNIFKQYL